MITTTFVLYGAALIFIFFYSLSQLNLVVNYLFSKKRYNKFLTEHEAKEPEEWPLVTVQLPLYNEQYVVERLIDSIAELDYPAEKLDIQILDDSTDSTTEIIQEKIKTLGEKGKIFNLVRRPERKGYKAGALKYGLTLTEAEYIAVFDADFLPKPEFLKKSIPYFFSEDKIGVVQTRWEHLNQNYSLLTKAQAFGLDAHFTVEQVGRFAKNHFINFNGTAGIWRKACIEDAGNWHADTLTEDLDLSYRAQMKGWKFVYKEDLGSPAELPATMNALKSQQFRWNKGAAENVRKNMGKVFRAKLPFSTKLHAFFHLLNSSVFLCIFTMAILSIPMILIKYFYGEQYQVIFDYATYFLASFIILLIFYGISYTRVRREQKVNIFKFIRLFPLFLSISMGLSLHNAIAVLEGYMGKKSAFIRTPKFNITSKKDKWKKNSYRIKEVNPVTFLEALLSVYFLGGIGLGIYIHDYGLMLLHIMLAYGFGLVSFYSIKHANA